MATRSSTTATEILPPIALAVQGRVSEIPTLAAARHRPGGHTAQTVGLPVLIEERHRGEDPAAAESLRPQPGIGEAQVQFGVTDRHREVVLRG